MKEYDFENAEHESRDKRVIVTILSGYTGLLDNLLKNGVRQIAVCLSRLRANRYAGSQATIRNCIADHQHFIPPTRYAGDPPGNRGRRYPIGLGKSYQMDWGVPRFTLFLEKNTPLRALLWSATTNMKSAVIRRDYAGHPLCQKDYEQFMRTVGFQTRLCKPHRPLRRARWSAWSVSWRTASWPDEPIHLCRNRGGEFENVAILVVIAVNEGGYREVLGAAERVKKDKASWVGFFQWLRSCGLAGVKLIVSDKCLGTLESVGEVFSKTKYQRCTVHFYRNMFSVAPRSKVKLVFKMFKAIHAQESKKAARKKPKPW